MTPSLAAFVKTSPDTSSSVIDSGLSGTAHLITLFRVNPKYDMVSQFIRAVLVLLLLAPIDIVAHLHPRQMSMNETATPTANSSQATSIATPPPCCWIVVGNQAVGYHSWYSTTAEQVVGRHKSLHSVHLRELMPYSSHCCHDLYPRA
jgi:hypothetical protein